MKNVLVLSSSRKGGNSDLLCEAFAAVPGLKMSLKSRKYLYG